MLGDGWDWRLGVFKGKRRAFFVIQWFTGVMAPASTLEGGMRDVGRVTWPQWVRELNGWRWGDLCQIYVNKKIGFYF